MKIVVLAGGTSTERDVSLVSGKQIYSALKKAGHDVVLLDVFLGLKTDDIDSVFKRGDELLLSIDNIKEQNPDINAVKALRPDADSEFFGPNVIDICKKADVVFMGLHGENGENGKVQAAFDLHGIRYTGNDYISSALAMDKDLSKDLFRFYDIKTPESYTLKKGETDDHTPKYPVVVKVTDGGSSIGVYIVHNDEEYKKAKESAFFYGNEVLVEKFVDGREFSVGVIKGKALPVIEIKPKEGFYDYKNKYQEGSTLETCPAELSDDKTKEVQKMAEDVYRALRLNQYARIDIMMDHEGEIYALEANTLPGMTPMSLMPQEAAAAGMSYIDFCEKIISIAMEK